MANKTENTLPAGATALIALARVSHRNGERQVEKSALDKLTREFGIDLHFPCTESVDRDLRAGSSKP